MRALKIPARVTHDHTLHLRLPEDVSEGPAEVIVLVPESDEDSPPETAAGSLDDFLASFEVDRRFIRSKEEIDEFVTEERESWE
jgi:hypothetical protein